MIDILICERRYSKIRERDTKSQLDYHRSKGGKRSWVRKRKSMQMKLETNKKDRKEKRHDKHFAEHFAERARKQRSRILAN